MDNFLFINKLKIDKDLTMFFKGKRGDNFMKMFIQEWILLFKDVKKELSNLWRKYCPMCICKHGKEKD